MRNKADKLREEHEGMMSEWFSKEHDKDVRKIRLRFDDKLPEIGERCLIQMDNCVYFGFRISLNFYQTGNHFIRTDDKNIKVISLIETQN